MFKPIIEWTSSFLSSKMLSVVLLAIVAAGAYYVASGLAERDTLQEQVNNLTTKNTTLTTTITELNKKITTNNQIKKEQAKQLQQLSSIINKLNVNDRRFMQTNAPDTIIAHLCKTNTYKGPECKK